MNKKKTICVIGLGYIGLPTAALLANKGFNVCGIDLNQKIIKTINNGKIHIVEKDLDFHVKSAISKGKLKVFSKIKKSDVYIICVPTPLSKKKTPQPDINFVIAATKSIAPFIKKGDFIILESTSPVGTTEKLKKVLNDLNVNLDDVHFAYCPERVLPGNIMHELVQNDRVIGGLTTVSTKKIKEFYKIFTKGKIIETDAKTAEMCKLAENSFRDINIAFANELSILSDGMGINSLELIKLANRHPRVNILQPGVGVGGHCIAVDPWFLIHQDKKNSKLIKSAREVNNYKTTWVIEKIEKSISRHISNNISKPKIACLGLTFKPNIDDIRESKALEILKTLLAKGYNVFGVEPNIETIKEVPILSLSEALKKADIICILVKHNEFIEPIIKKKLIKYRALDFCGALF